MENFAKNINEYPQKCSPAIRFEEAVKKRVYGEKPDLQQHMNDSDVEQLYYQDISPNSGLTSNNWLSPKSIAKLINGSQDTSKESTPPFNVDWIDSEKIAKFYDPPQDTPKSTKSKYQRRWSMENSENFKEQTDEKEKESKLKSKLYNSHGNYEIEEYQHNGKTFKLKKPLNSLMDKKRKEEEEKEELSKKHLPCIVTMANRHLFIDTKGFGSTKFGRSSTTRNNLSFSTSMRQTFSASAFPQQIRQQMPPHEPVFGQSMSQLPLGLSASTMNGYIPYSNASMHPFAAGAMPYSARYFPYPAANFNGFI